MIIELYPARKEICTLPVQISMYPVSEETGTIVHLEDLGDLCCPPGTPLLTLIPILGLKVTCRDSNSFSLFSTFPGGFLLHHRRSTLRWPSIFDGSDNLKSKKETGFAVRLTSWFHRYGWIFDLKKSQILYQVEVGYTGSQGNDRLKYKY